MTEAGFLNEMLIFISSCVNVTGVLMAVVCVKHALSEHGTLRIFWSHPFAATADGRSFIDVEDARDTELNTIPTSPYDEKHCHEKLAT